MKAVSRTASVATPASWVLFTMGDAVLTRLGLPNLKEAKCRLRDGFLLVPAVVGRDSAYLLLDTGSQGGVVLDLAYATERRLPVSDWHQKPSAFDPDRWRKAGVTRLDRVSVLGQTIVGQAVSVCDLLSPEDPLRGEIAGFLGPSFVQHGVLVVAPSCGVVAFTDSGDPQKLVRAADVSFSLLPVPGEFLPFTTDVKDAVLPEGEPPVALLDTGSQRSMVSMDYLRKKRGHRMLRWFLERAFRRGARVLWTFELPGGVSLKTRVDLDSFSPNFIRGTGMDRVDAILGMDFFSSWITAVDFRARVVGLFRPPRRE